MAVDVERRSPSPSSRDYVERTFRQRRAATRASRFDVDARRRTCRRRSRTDATAPAAGPEEPALERLQVHRHGRGRRCASSAADRGWTRGHDDARPRRRRCIAFSVSDTGIGIPPRQAADHLRGLPAGRRHHQPQVRRHRAGPVDQPRDRAAAGRRDPRRAARPAPGSTFTLYLPRTHVRAGAARASARRCSALPAAPGAVSPIVSSAARAVAHRPSTIATSVASPGDRVLLIVEDDATFAADPARAWRATAASRGWSPRQGDAGLAWRASIKPDAITLDIRLPDIDGWVVLDRLKHDPATRHIPVHVISRGRSRARARLSWARCGFAHQAASAPRRSTRALERRRGSWPPSEPERAAGRRGRRRAERQGHRSRSIGRTTSTSTAVADAAPRR